jgi:hypothetical protein
MAALGIIFRVEAENIYEGIDKKIGDVFLGWAKK